MLKVPSPEPDAIRAFLEAKAALTPTERRELNKSLRDAAKERPRSKGPMLPLLCSTCLARMPTVAAMDRHRDKAGHRRFYVALTELATPKEGL